MTDRQTDRLTVDVGTVLLTLTVPVITSTYDIAVLKITNVRLKFY